MYSIILLLTILIYGVKNCIRIFLIFLCVIGYCYWNVKRVNKDAHVYILKSLKHEMIKFRNQNHYH